ncbi:filamentous hemagglutinin N-terminal domain-containing protein, partial [bacterium]|nr:filamentous hemagglutinin N-terminal domain-containing protein [bacterium]
MRKLLSTTIAAGIFVSMGMTPVWADVVGATELPVYNSTGSSKVTVSDPFLDAADGKMTKNITIDKGTYNVGVANWDKFNIGKDAKVQVLFSSHHQTSINKVAQSGGLSQIYGSFVSGTSCAGCAYNETGKVILLNPNGVFFGNGANVDINSFTASNMKGTWEEDSNREGYITLKLSKYNSGELDSSVDNNYGIKVDKGATIKADTNLTFAANNIDIYNGSQISTNTTTPNITFVNNAATEAFGKVYLVTSDGVNFTYARHGGVESMDNKVANSENAMKLNINGDITTGHLEAHNYSKNIDSEISTNGALLKAVKAEKGNDGSILLVSNSRVVSTDSSIGAGGDLTMTAPQKVNIKNDNINVAGNITLTATDGNGLKYTKEVTKNNVKTTEEYTNDGNVLIDSSKVKAGKTVTLTTPKIAGIQNSSDVEANDIVINGGTFGQVTGKAKVNATNNVTIAANDIWFDRADVTAGNKISATAANNIYSWDAAGNNAASSFDAPTIELTAKNGDVTSKYTCSTKIGT